MPEFSSDTVKKALEAARERDRQIAHASRPQNPYERISELERQLEEIKRPESLAHWLDTAKAAESRAQDLERQLAEAEYKATQHNDEAERCQARADSAEQQLAEARGDLRWMTVYREQAQTAAKAATQAKDRAHEREDEAAARAVQLREALERSEKAYKEAMDGMDIALTKLPAFSEEAAPFSARCKILTAMSRARAALAGDGGQEKETGIGSVGPVGGIGDGRPRFGKPGGQEKEKSQ